MVYRTGNVVAWQQNGETLVGEVIWSNPAECDLVQVRRWDTGQEHTIEPVLLRFIAEQVKYTRSTKAELKPQTSGGIGYD